MPFAQNIVLPKGRSVSDRVSYVGEEIRCLASSASYALDDSICPVIGFSPFNSYYDEEMIRSWLSWAHANHSSYYLYLPTELSKFNFLSSGYDMPSAMKKTKRQDAYLFNKILRSFDALDISIDRSKIITTEALSHCPLYNDILKIMIDLYDNNSVFSDILNQASSDFFSKKLSPCDGFEISVQYVIHELPVLLFSSVILDKKDTAFFYNRIPDFIARLFSFFSNKGELGYPLSPFAGLSMSPVCLKQ